MTSVSQEPAATRPAVSHAPPPCRRHTASATTTITTGVNKRGRVLHRVRDGQGDARGGQQGRPGPGRAASRPDAQPDREGQQEQRQRVIGREGAQELGAGEGGEQPRGQQRGPLSVQPAGRGPQQAGDPEHEAQRQHARGGQAADAVRERADRRVEDRRPGEVRGEVGDRRPVQPPGPLQVPGPQVQGLVLKRRVGPRRAAGTGPPARPGRPAAATTPGPPAAPAGPRARTSGRGGTERCSPASVPRVRAR